MVLDDYKVVL